MANITIRDIAKKANVSATTVSRVLNDSGYVKEETKQAILKAIEELNYVPSAVARSLSKSETNTIGVVVPDLSNPFFSDIVRGINNKADETDFTILLMDTNEDHLDKEVRYLKMLKEQRIRGLIITPTSEKTSYSSDYVKLLRSLGVPIVLIDRDIKRSTFDGVFADDYNGSSEAFQVLIDEGHTEIGIIAGPTTSRPGRERLKAYRDTLEANEIAIKDCFIKHGDFKLQSGYELTMEFLNQEEKPTAIFASNNMMGMGCVKAIYAMGLRIPEDISLIVFDGVEIFDIMNLPISVITRPTVRMGELAMEILYDRIMNDPDALDVTRRLTLNTKLVLKGSEKKLVGK